MIKLLVISLFVCLQGLGQAVKIGSRSYIRSSGVTSKNTYILVSPGGYADYPLTITQPGGYKFNVRTANLAGKSAYMYIWSPASQSWTNTSLQAPNPYQDAVVSVTLDTATKFVRVYFPDSAAVDNIAYWFDTTAINYRVGLLEQRLSLLLLQISKMPTQVQTVNLQPITDKINALQNRMDSVGTLYVVPGYGTQLNPIKP